MSCSDYSDQSGCGSDASTHCSSQSSDGRNLRRIDGRGQCDNNGNNDYDRGRLRFPPGIYDRVPYGAIPIGNYGNVNRVGYNARAPSGLSLKIPINPISNLKGLWSKDDNAVHIFIERKNNVVTLQWEGFSGIIGGEGFSYVAANISFDGLPIAPIEEIIRVIYRGIARHGYIRIDPYHADVIQFHFSGLEEIRSVVGDRIVVPGACINWITRC